jgi:hypothetical protein
MESRAVRKLINHEQGKKRIDNEMERAGGRERERESACPPAFIRPAEACLIESDEWK